jgi:hypothetical protein
MALLQDGPISSLEDLRTYESSLLDTATVESVSLSNKIALAQQEVENEILRFLIQQLEPTESVTPSKLAQVVATEPLRRWHALRTLAVFFRDVHHNQLNDRYRAKWEAYETEARAAARLLWEVGVGLVRSPLKRPEPPALTTLFSDEEFPQVLFKVSWVVGSNEESAVSDAELFAPLVPEQPQLTVANPPARATGWHVYAGPTEQLLTRQTATAVELTEPWVLPSSVLVEGPPAPFGQAPDHYVRLQRLLFRG